MHSTTKTLLLVVILGLPVVCAHADGDLMPLDPAQANISIYEPAQRAIIGWNGQTEIMILSVDARTSAKNAKVLQFVPLPSRPTRVEEGSFDSFQGVQGMIAIHRPTALELGIPSAGGG